MKGCGYQIGFSSHSVVLYWSAQFLNMKGKHGALTSSENWPYSLLGTGRRGERRGYGGGGRGRSYTYRYTTRMTYALRWAAMRAILIFQ